MSQMSLDLNDTRQTPFERDEYHFLNAIDRPRDAGAAYGVVKRTVDLSMSEEPTTSTVSLNNCEESLTTDSEFVHNGQQSLDCQRSFEQEQQSDGRNSDKAKFRAESQPSQPGDSYQLIRISSARKAKTKSFTFSTTNENITKPLLEEDNL